MAFPVVEEAIESSTNTAGTSHVVSLPTATANQLLLIILDKGSTSATINTHASLTELLDEASANGLYIAYRWMDGTEPSTYTLTSSVSTRSARIAYRISGAINPSVQAPQIGTTGTGTSATPDPPASASPGSTQDYLFIAFYGAAGEELDDDTWSNTPPTDYTPSPPRQKSCGTAGTNLGGLIAAAERQLNTGSAQNPGTFAKDVSAAWRAQTIMVSPSDPQLVTPATATLTTERFAPGVTETDHQLVTPSTASLTTTEFEPTVVASSPQLVTPATQTTTIERFAPTVTTTEHQTVVPGTAGLTLSEFAPSVTAGESHTVTPTTADLTLTEFVPTVTGGSSIEVVPGTRSFTTERFAPNVTASEHRIVTPETGTLMVERFVPTVTGGSSGIEAVPGQASLVLTTFAPLAFSTDPVPILTNGQWSMVVHLFPGDDWYLVFAGPSADAPRVRIEMAVE